MAAAAAAARAAARAAFIRVAAGALTLGIVAVLLPLAAALRAYDPVEHAWYRWRGTCMCDECWRAEKQRGGGTA